MTNVFSLRLKQARELCGYTQNDLANLIGVSRQTIANYETGLREPSLYILSKLTDVLKVSFEWLNGSDENRKLTSEFMYNTDNKRYLNIFSTRLKINRERHNYSTEYCAKMLKIDLPEYLNLENGNTLPSLLLICKIADMLSTSVDWLLGKDSQVPLTDLISHKYIPSPFDENLRNRLIMLRLLFCYTVEDVAFFIRIKPSEYERFEKGESDPPVAIMLNLARLYKLPVESLSLPNDYFLEELEKRFSKKLSLN